MKTKTSMDLYLAWGVHVYTALGGVVGFFALVAATRQDYISAFGLLLLSSVIDATDGLLARSIHVKNTLPFFDGSMLDNVIDIFTYAWVPFFIISSLTTFSTFILVLPILAALYAYGQVNMKSEDNYFIGFPTYWNIVALYFYLLSIDGSVGTLILGIFSLLTFIPSKYLYPSKHKNKAYRLYFFIGGVVWLIVCAYVLVSPNITLTWLSLVYPVSYLLLSFYESLRLGRSSLSQTKGA